MEYNHYFFELAEGYVARFEPGNDSCHEYHIMLRVTDTHASFKEQLHALMNAYNELISTKLPGARAVIKRYFLSDAANQMQTVQALSLENDTCAVSIIEQPPLNGTKIAMWVYLLTQVSTRMLNNGLFEVKSRNHRQLWCAGEYNKAANSEYQMRLLFNDYILRLNDEGCSLADNCLRTWLFVQNVDVNYPGVVKARREVFKTQHLTEQTHYIASTGIGGRQADPQVLVQMDAVSLQGHRPEQVHYLYARQYLNPTYEYGVTFERGTYVDFGDRRQVYISGTASINNRGEVVYPGEVTKQLERLWLNVEALLHEAGCGYEHVGMMVVYLRDVADYALVKDAYDRRFPHTPKLIVLAPVCRQGWLVEMECMAVMPQRMIAYKPF